MSYTEKIKEMSYEEMILGDPNGSEMILGIPYEGLISLSSEEWADWIIDRILHEQYNEIGVPHYREDSSPGSLFNFFFKEPSSRSQGELPTRYLSENQPKFLSNMVKGMIKAGQILLEESVQGISQERYALARDRLFGTIRLRFRREELGVKKVKKLEGKHGDEEIFRGLEIGLSKLECLIS